ncbi:hypothetical protein D0861_04973 [Hortaea werneckii]|uniref:Uncharacterized protein n=1 Tax=Hortaea werneckii TaxID=91943 RepID=A0A3M7FH49_HORWE|nr:hypothetical protein D0861_04973 [Hortaea werneckii]
MAAIGDHVSHTLATAESSQKPCGLLELPPELRNNIYKLCFKTVHDNRSSFNAPTPPETAVLQTCRQIRNEAAQICQVADREYWSDSHFWLQRETYEQAKADAESMRSEKLRLINKITIAVPSHEFPAELHLATRETKSWGASWVSPLDARYVIIMVRTKQAFDQAGALGGTFRVQELLGLRLCWFRSCA